MAELEDLLRELASELADIVVNSTGSLSEGPWDRYMTVDHFSPGHKVGTEAVWVGSEEIVDRSADISMQDFKLLNRRVREFRRDFPVPLWLFDGLVLVVDREPVRGVVHVVCGDVAAGFEASMATAGQVQDRAAAMFLGLSEPS
ncbi:hypothetical protein ACPXB3_22425, partial [Gordonia sp. DT219]